jgi:hypothetical protein
MKKQEKDAVIKWHQALNTRDEQQMNPIVTPDVKLIGPKGTAVGIQAMLEWVKQSGIRMVVTAFYYKHHCVIAAQEATWAIAEADKHLLATAFKFKGGQIFSIQRYSSLHEALIAEGMDESHKV